MGKSNIKVIWEKRFGGKYDNEFISVKETKDKNYIILGNTQFIGDGLENGWIIKLDKNGNIIWEKTFTRNDNGRFNSLLETKDGNYIVVGYVLSENNDRFDSWIIKLDKEGNIVWEKTFSIDDFNEFNSIQETEDNGYIIVGNIKRGMDIDSQTVSNGWIVKLDENGNKVWEKIFDESNFILFNSICKTKDNNYVIVGAMASENSNGISHCIIKIDKKGNKIWEKFFSGSFTYGFNSIIETKYGDYIIVGDSIPNNIGIRGNDGWIIKLDKNGNKIWEKNFGGKYYDRFFSVSETIDSKYIVVGYTTSKNIWKKYGWIILLDKDSNLIWEKFYNKRGDEEFYSVQQTEDNTYLVVGKEILDDKTYGLVVKFK